MVATHVLVAQRIHDDGLALFDGRQDITYHIADEFSEADLWPLMAEADAITVRNATITRKLIEAAPKLKIITRHGVGYDNIDMAAASERGIPVAVAATANAVSVAEHTLMMMLSIAKSAKPYDKGMREDNFGVRYETRALDLAGRTVLILGLGRIGRRVAKLCKAFGMQVLGYDPYLSSDEIRMRDCEPVRGDWREILPNIDVLTVHTPKKADTIGMINAEVLTALPEHAIVVNCARGGIVHEADLRAALENNSIFGAGLDVFDIEPTSGNDPLLHLPNILVSPHSAATTREGVRRMAMECSQNILDFLDGTLEADRVVNAKEIGFV